MFQQFSLLFTACKRGIYTAAILSTVCPSVNRPRDFCENVNEMKVHFKNRLRAGLV